MNRGLFSFVGILSLVLFSVMPRVAAQDDDASDPNEWVVETYAFPSDDLVRGFASEERGALKAPPMPDADASEEEIRDFMRKSSSVVTHFLEMNGLAFPKGAMILFDPVSLTMTARLPRIAQSSVSFTADANSSYIEKYIEMNPMIIEAPAATIRSHLDSAGSTPDHTAILDALLEEVDAGNAEILLEGRLESRSGQRAMLKNTIDRSYPSELVLGPNNEVDYSSEDMEEGAVVEVDSVIGADEETIDINMSLNYHYAPSVRRQAAFTELGDVKVSQAITETYVAQVTSQYTIYDGRTKLLGVWKPAFLPGGGEPVDVLQAAFLPTRLVRVLPLENTILAEYIREHGEAVMPIPEGQPEFEKVADEIPEGMIVRRYVIPPTFLSSGGGGGGAAASDPFASAPSNEPTFMIRATAQDILEAAGIAFPLGSSANFLSATSTLVVRNTPENIQLVEAYIMSISQGVERTIPVSVHIVQGPAAAIKELVRSTRGLPDHTPQWEQVQQQDEISVVSTCWLESRSGQRAKVQSGRSFSFPVEAYTIKGLPFDEEEKENEEGNVSSPHTVEGVFESELIGTVFEFDPVLGADEQTIDINYSLRYDFAPPSTSGGPAIEDGSIAMEGPTTVFHRAKVAGQSTLRSGMIRLLSTWRPEGTPEFDQADILQAVFLKVEALSQEEEVEGLE